MQLKEYIPVSFITQEIVKQTIQAIHKAILLVKEQNSPIILPQPVEIIISLSLITLPY
jgi:hypothetical protein